MAVNRFFSFTVYNKRESESDLKISQRKLRRYQLIVNRSGKWERHQIRLRVEARRRRTGRE